MEHYDIGKSSSYLSGATASTYYKTFHLFPNYKEDYMGFRILIRNEYVNYYLNGGWYKTIPKFMLYKFTFRNKAIRNYLGFRVLIS